MVTLNRIGVSQRHVALSVIIIAVLTVAGCMSKHPQTAVPEEAHPLPDTLRVATLYSPTSYFLYRDEPMGYDYSLLMQFASDKGIAVDLKVAPSLGKMIEMLDSGEVDLLACEIPVTAEYQKKIAACGPEQLTHQVLVQPRKAGEKLITDATQLAGKEVYVEANSKYQYRLQNLNDEIGGGIKIHPIDRDTIITEDLIEMVSKGEIPLTVVDSDIARINKTYYRDLDVSLPLSFPQKARWGTSSESRWLADSVNAWFAQETPRQRQALLLKRYFELSKDDSGGNSYVPDFSAGKISPYDNLFKTYAGQIGMDWRLMAAQGWHESHFEPERVSWAGARGIMQIMPRTARAYDLPASKISDPEANISTAAKIIRDLDKSLSRKVSDATERRKFVIAAYNSGIAHVLDAIALAEKYGKNPQIWDGNVESALLMKANPEYYSDPVCRAGYFRGRQTVAYVRDVMKFYEQARKKISL
ncbi:MAG: transglycosylase SLT domain-containing protein [Muribaculaceae bacterium]|nr:transglycosylase SLT domain-containing protein [Muribaculaceae bacterium]